MIGKNTSYQNLKSLAVICELTKVELYYVTKKTKVQLVLFLFILFNEKNYHIEIKNFSFKVLYNVKQNSLMSLKVPLFQKLNNKLT